jgi:hypothetical protein
MPLLMATDSRIPTYKFDRPQPARWDWCRRRGYGAVVTEQDPLVPVLAGLVVDLLWWLDTCGDDEIDPDSAVKMMEGVSWVLTRLPAEQRERFLQVVNDLATAEEHPGRRAQLVAFPFACGLVENEAPHRGGPWTAWVHPASRASGGGS